MQKLVEPGKTQCAAFPPKPKVKFKPKVIQRCCLGNPTRGEKPFPLSRTPQPPHEYAGAPVVLVTRAKLDEPVVAASECRETAVTLNLLLHPGCPHIANFSNAVLLMLDSRLAACDLQPSGTAPFQRDHQTAS